MMKNRCIIGRPIVFLSIALLAVFIQQLNSDYYDLFQENVEALTSNETIVLITCVPEDDSICITYDATYPVVDYYFSPH